jgi:ABC-type phosphate/phosphonate transport system substrate-binding protein
MHPAGLQAPGRGTSGERADEKRRLNTGLVIIVQRYKGFHMHTKWFVHRAREVTRAVAALVLLAGLLAWQPQNGAAAEPSSNAGERPQSLTLIVMDPLAAPLACDCVAGYANRQYQLLGDHLRNSLGVAVEVVWSESLSEALESKTAGRCDVVIGKDSVIRAQAKKIDRKLLPAGSLTDPKGSTTQHGLFVVRSGSSAASILDLEGSTIFFGPEDCDEKWAAPRRMLEELEIPVSDQSKCYASCSVAATALMELPAGSSAAAVISSYAAPLLEGCGTIRKGDLTVVGQSEPVRFVSAFVSAELPESMRSQIAETLQNIRDPKLLAALESEKGFVAYGD